MELHTRAETVEHSENITTPSCRMPLQARRGVDSLAVAQRTDPMPHGHPIERSGVSFVMNEFSLRGGLPSQLGVLSEIDELGDELHGLPTGLPSPAAPDSDQEAAAEPSDAAEQTTLGNKPLSRANSRSEFARAEALDLAEACPEPDSPATPSVAQKRARLGLSRASSQPREWWEQYLT